MKIKQQLIFTYLMVLIMIYCSYGKQTDGLVFELKKEKETDARLLKIQVCTENISHVYATPEKTFSTKPSLMADRTDWPTVQYSVTEEGNQTVLSTSKVTVKIHRGKGTIT